MTPMARPGVTLPELILVAWLFALVLGAVGKFAAAQGQLVARIHDRVRVAEVVRVAQVVLGAELRALAPADVSAFADDSLRIRAVRGGGPVCQARNEQLTVRFRGVRRPEPAKDSLLLIRAGDTDGPTFAISDVVSDPTCGPGGLRLTLEREVADATGLALLFETGSYSIGDGALRYRRGAGGRQPLTEAVLREGSMQVFAPDQLTIALDFDVRLLPRLDTGHVASVRLRSPGAIPP